MKKYFLFLIIIIASHTFSQEVKDSEKVFTNDEVDEKPIYKEGAEAFYKFIAKTFKVPAEQGLKGRVIVQFIVEKDGSISNFAVIQDIGYGTAEEATRVFKNCPNWKPGKKDGQKVRTLIKITIKLSET